MHFSDYGVPSCSNRNALGHRHSVAGSNARRDSRREAAGNSALDLSFRTIIAWNLGFRWLSCLLHPLNDRFLDHFDGTDANADLSATSWRAGQKLYRSKPILCAMCGRSSLANNGFVSWAT